MHSRIRSNEMEAVMFDRRWESSATYAYHIVVSRDFYSIRNHLQLQVTRSQSAHQDPVGQRLETRVTMGVQMNRYPALWSLPRTRELKPSTPHLENMVLTIVFHNGLGTLPCTAALVLEPMTVYEEIDSMIFEGSSVSH
jgi:hypothetical protein